MLFLDLSNCGPSGILRVIYFFKLILDIVFIIIPIALIILLIIDFSKAMISGDEGAQSKIFKLATKRILYAVIVFCVPYIVSIFNLVLGELGVDYSACYNDITLDAINVLEAEEIAIEEAKKAARLALLEEQRKKAEEEEEERKKEEEQKNNSNSSLPKVSGCDGLIYYENGTFYKPSSSYKNGTPETKGSAAYGYNKYFYSMLTKMVEDGKKAGYTITPSKTIDGAWRSYERQQYFWNCYQTKKCNNGNLAARPGTSNHGWGIASDLKYGSNKARDWAHKNASKYGLKFTECKDYFNGKCAENWHIAPAKTKSDNSVVKKCK